MMTSQVEMPGQNGVEARRAVMDLCACASEAELNRALVALSPIPEMRDLRPAETGSVMLRGRAGGDGAPFNVGEATVTRAALGLGEGDGPRGFAFHLGRATGKARKAAALDLLWQDPKRTRAVEHALAPIRERLDAEAALAARRAAATRVNFFTLVRGED